MTTRFSKIEHTDNRIFVLFIGDAQRPDAAYVSANGDQYDAYYDFVYGYCGSPLWDIVEKIDYETFMAETVSTLTDKESQTDPEDGYWGWDPEIVEIRVPDDMTIDEATGLSIWEIRREALDKLVGYAMWSFGAGRELQQKRREIIEKLLEMAQ